MSDKKKLIKAVFFGTLCGMLSSVILMCVLAAVMLTSGLLPDSLINYIMIAIAAAGALLGGFVAAKLNKGAGLLVGLITGSAIFLIITAAALIEGGTSVSGLTGIRFLAMLIGGALGGILGLRERKKISI